MKYLPGLSLASGLAILATFLAEWLGVDLLGYTTSPISAVLVAVFLGLVIGNAGGVSGRFEPGLELCVKRLLRIGIALLGIRLSLLAAASIGLVALPIIIACIAAAVLLVTALARLMRLPPRLGLLIAAGTSICGITAIVAVAPVIQADENETSYAVATIALFGMLALFSYPFLAHLLFTEATHVGMFLGTAIHDTSQVVGAALAYEEQYRAPETLNAAVVTKLVRNLSMVAVIPLIGLLRPRESEPGGDAPATGGVVPLFILGFLAMVLVRTVGDMGGTAFGFLPRDTWEQSIGWVQTLAEASLLLAMAAVGLRTRLRTLYILGMKPLTAGLAAALAVGVVSATFIHLLAAADLA